MRFVPTERASKTSLSNLYSRLTKSVFIGSPFRSSISMIVHSAIIAGESCVPRLKINARYPTTQAPRGPDYIPYPGLPTIITTFYTCREIRPRADNPTERTHPLNMYWAICIRAGRSKEPPSNPVQENEGERDCNRKEAAQSDP